MPRRAQVSAVWFASVPLPHAWPRAATTGTLATTFGHSRGLRRRRRLRRGRGRSRAIGRLHRSLCATGGARARGQLGLGGLGLSLGRGFLRLRLRLGGLGLGLSGLFLDLGGLFGLLGLSIGFGLPSCTQRSPPASRSSSPGPCDCGPLLTKLAIEDERDSDLGVWRESLRWGYSRQGCPEEGGRTFSSALAVVACALASTTAALALACKPQPAHDKDSAPESTP